MSDKEKIINEIQRRINLFRKDGKLGSDTEIALYGLINFINAMQEEPINEDLEEELSAYVNSEEYLNNIGTSGLLLIARHFADWQKSQLSKCSCELKVLEYEGMPTTGSVQLDFPKGIFKAGEKIKLLIIKEDKS